MAIKRATKTVDVRTGNDTYQSKTILGSLLQLDTPFETNNFEAFVDGVVRIYNGNSGGTTMTAYVCPYYFNHNDSIFLSDLICRGTQYSSAAEMADAVSAYVLSHLGPGMTSIRVDSPTLSQFTAKGQMAFGTKNGRNICPWFRVEGTYGETQIGVPVYNCQITIWLQVAIWSGTAWTSARDVHPVLYGQVDSRLGVTSAADVDRMIEMVFNELTKYELSIGPGATWENTGAGMIMKSVVNTATNYYIMTHSAYATGLGIISKCLLINSANTTNNWNQNGEVDPEDPWIEPDPYNPVPPDPTPPGPGPDPTPIVDPIPIPNFPPISGAAIGIYTAFNPNTSQLQQIASKLWDPDVWSAIKQMFTNPMEAIFGLAIVPANPVTGTSKNVYLGRYNTQVSVPVISNDYVNVDCGSVAIKKFYGSYLDHDPYTKYSLYLPYIGEMELNADEITGRVMHIEYHCNVITGDVVALVALDNRVCYTGMGNFIRQLPLSQTDFSSVIQTAVSAAATVLTAAVAGVGGAAVAGAAGAKSIAKTRAQARVASNVANGTSSVLNDVMGAKFNYKHAGKLGQGAGQLGVQKPFLTIIRPNLALPEGNDLSPQSNLKAYTGYPCNKIMQLSSCHGFTQVEACKLQLADATDSELAEVYELLEGGVLF